MTIISFPPVSQADRSGLLAVGGDLDVNSLLLAYRSGIFPWPVDGDTLAWFAPPLRAILFFDEFHISHKLARQKRKSAMTFTMNQAFPEVIDACATPINRGRQKGSWITREIREAYMELFQQGYCLSVEAWSAQGRLVGGLYGVRMKRMFAGESMFYRENNASKLALCFLVDHLRDQGLSWIDCQVMTPLFESFGAREITRSQFSQILLKALSD